MIAVEPQRFCAAALVVALAAAGAARAGTPLKLADGGRAAMPVVLAVASTAAERTAAREVSDYLERVTGAPFAVVAADAVTADEPAIRVGPAAGFGPEQWRVRTSGASLVLEGGRPRGTLYAVYHFLEDVVGVRWWTPYDETIPRLPSLSVGEIDLGGSPAFAYRDVYGIDGPPEFSARSRHNGHESRLGADHGGREAYGPPGGAHDFYAYVPPEEFFATHPEYFSQIRGERVGDRAQICLANADVRRIVVERLSANIDRARGEAAASGEEPPRLFPLSQNDWGGGCSCDLCSVVDRRERSRAGSLVEFLDDVAARIAERYPDVLIDTLAYHYSFPPPRAARLPDNVVVRLSALQRRDFSKPVTRYAHREYRWAIEGWGRVTSHLRIWDYSVTFGSGAEMPLANLKVIAEDFRYYLGHGVEGVYIQHDPPVRADLRDLKVWVVLKLLEDPYRDVDALVREFTDGFYGPAGETVRAYLARLERAIKYRPSAIGYPVAPTDYRWLTPRFLREAQGLFDEAERRAAGDAEITRRLRFARLSIDRATLLRWSDKLWRATAKGPALDPELVAERYWLAVHEQLARRSDLKAERIESRVADEIIEVLTGLGYAPPEE